MSKGANLRGKHSRMTRQRGVPIKVLKIRYRIVLKYLAEPIIYKEIHPEVKN